MIEVRSGDLLKSDAQALVNPVNCMGVMGKGLALQFKRRFPENFKLYHDACKAVLIQPGYMFTTNLHNNRYIINFPTKMDWRANSRIEYIQSGLVALVALLRDKSLDIRSIAIPPLGCGLGGLDWKEVRPLIEKAFEGLPTVKVLLFAPAPHTRKDY